MPLIPPSVVRKLLRGQQIFYLHSRTTTSTDKAGNVRNIRWWRKSVANSSARTKYATLLCRLKMKVAHCPPAIPLAQFHWSGDNPNMSGTPALYSPNAMRAEKRAVAGNSVIAAVLITVGKIIVGVSTGSLGILSEAAPSALDLIASLLTYFSVGVSDKPADADHQYGHGKVENFSAFVETGFLLLTCAWAIYEGILRLFFRQVEVEPSIWAFAVMLVSMAVDWWRSRALARIATKYESQALEADALNFSPAIWSSGVVLVGLVLILLGRVYRLDWVRVADPISALFVAGVIVSVSWR